MRSALLSRRQMRAAPIGRDLVDIRAALTPDEASAWQRRREAGADYHRAAVVNGVDVRCLLVEVFGGFGPELEQLIDELAVERQDKLNRNEYDETTWSARTWKSFTRQKLSIALHRAVATELVQALGLSHVADTRD